EPILVGWLRASTPHVTQWLGHSGPWGQQNRTDWCQPLALLGTPQDSASHVTVLPLHLYSMSSSLYDYEISGPLGRDNYKEMYLFIYRTDTVSVVDTYQYEDPEDVFSRAPFILRVSVPHTKVEEFVLVPLHSAPHDAVTEIDALYDVYLDIVSKWGTDNIMFLGDFNADCTYVQRSDWLSIRLRTSDIFKWLLPDSADTTVGKSDCAYDSGQAQGQEWDPSLASPWQDCGVRSQTEEKHRAKFSCHLQFPGCFPSGAGGGEPDVKGPRGGRGRAQQSVSRPQGRPGSELGAGGGS
uniref:Deoxyribonuclease 1 like 2 n=1 Tax=Athene cunicularia TaxID=194338 RepID=A0A663LND7_ATHCN